MEPPEGTEECRYTPQNPWTPPQRAGYDSFGAEMAPNSRVWKKYVEETDKMDKELVEGWNKTLDVILIFAALFSAISTAFVLESSKDLKPDYTQTSAQTLFLMSQSLSAIATGSSINNSVIAVPDPESFAPSSSAVAVNILWFLSLSLSVAVSLIAILAKDWCSFFMSGRVGPMLKQGRMRQQRWDGIKKWKMKEIMNVLPLLMHIALLLFAIGLSVYLWDMNMHVALPVVITTSLAALFYMVAVSLPLIFAFCPYTTALTRFLYPHWLAFMDQPWTKVYVGLIASSVAWLSHTLASRTRTVWNFICSAFYQTSANNYGDTPASSPLECSPFSFQQKQEEIVQAVEYWADSMRGVFSTGRLQLDEPATPMDNVTSSMLSWMIANCEDPKAVDVALQALAGADRLLPRRLLWECGAVQLVCRRVDAGFELLRLTVGNLQPNFNLQLDDTSLYTRSLTFLTAFFGGEGLEIQGFFTTKFTLNSEPRTFDGIQDAADYAYRIIIWKSNAILNYSWGSLAPRYDLIAYEFDTVPNRADIDAFTEMEQYRNQCLKQWELVGHVIAGRVPNLPLNALLAMLNGITKTYLYNCRQSPSPLVRLLQSVDRDKASNHDLLRAIAIALAVAAFSTGSFSTDRKHPDAELVLDAEQQRLEQANQVYIELRTKGLDTREVDRLLFFGLLCLLGDTGELGRTLDTSGIKSIQACLDSLKLYSMSNATYHSLISSIPSSLGCGQHFSEILSGLIHAATPQTRQKPESMVESKSLFLLRIETALGNRLCYKFVNVIIPTLIRDFTNTDPVQLNQLRFRGINKTFQGLDRDGIRSDLGKFLNQMANPTLPATGCLVPSGMQVLWTTGGELLNLARRQRVRLVPAHSATVKTLLSTLYNPFTIKLAGDEYPTDFNELGLADHWLPKIVEMCRKDPTEVLDSELLETMIRFYQDEQQSGAKPRTKELPDLVDSEWTWLEILQELEDSCKPAVAIEKLGKLNTLLERQVEAP